MSNKLNLSILCGGQSAEHEISILSASNIVTALDKHKYNITIIYISRDGRWFLTDDIETFLAQGGPQHLVKIGRCDAIAISLGQKYHSWVSLNDSGKRYEVDCVFPVLHGTLGEDGAPQGLLEMMNIPYVGANVIGSALCMQKHMAKQLLRAAGLPVVDWQIIQRNERVSFDDIVAKLGHTLFIKPMSMGSSVGISKVRTEHEFQDALQHAFLYDNHVIIETYISGRELECSVLGNENPVASLPGEIITSHDFYSYDAKYLDPNGAQIITPADLPDRIIETIQHYAIAAFQVLHCAGMARVDFFMQDEKIIINELNTIPGFTDISMYLKNWEVSGLSQVQLLDNLIQLALQNYKQQHSLSTMRFVNSDDNQLDANKPM